MVWKQGVRSWEGGGRAMPHPHFSPPIYEIAYFRAKRSWVVQIQISCLRPSNSGPTTLSYAPGSLGNSFLYCNIPSSGDTFDKDILAVFLREIGMWKVAIALYLPSTKWPELPGTLWCICQNARVWKTKTIQYSLRRPCSFQNANAVHDLICPFGVATAHP